MRRVCALLQRSTTPSSQRFNKQDSLSCVVSWCSVHLLFSGRDRLRSFSSKIAPAVSSSYRLSALVLIETVRFPSDLWIVFVRHCHNALFLSVCVGIVRSVADTVFEAEITS